MSLALSRLPVSLRVIGLIGWTWIVAQAIAGGSSDAAVATLFLWVYGWVGLAIVCALIGPAWHFLDPFSTLHDLGAAALEATLLVLHGRKSAAHFCSSDAPVSWAYLFEGKPAVRTRRRRHAFTARPATLGFPHFHNSSGNRVTGSKDRHDTLDCSCTWRQLLLLRLLL